MTHRSSESTGGYGGGGTGGPGERDKGIQKYKLAVTKQSEGYTVQHRNIVDNILITMYGVRWGLGIWEGPVCKVHDCLTTMLYT